MGAKEIILLACGMSFSFATILGVVGVVSFPFGGRSTEPLPVLRSPPPPRAPTSGAGDVAANRGGRSVGSALLRGSDSSSGNPGSIEPIAAAIEARTDSTLGRLPFPAASTHLDEVQRYLERQLAALKKSRDLMLDDLAAQLRAMSPESAASEIRILDDESASLALSRLPASQRKAVLRILDTKRAQVLDRKLRTYAAK